MIPILKDPSRGVSFAPSELCFPGLSYPRLAPWAAFFRRFVAGIIELISTLRKSRKVGTPSVALS